MIELTDTYFEKNILLNVEDVVWAYKDKRDDIDLWWLALKNGRSISTTEDIFVMAKLNYSDKFISINEDEAGPCIVNINYISLVECTMQMSHIDLSITNGKDSLYTMDDVISLIKEAKSSTEEQCL